jgi:hypothetical protein
MKNFYLSFAFLLGCMSFYFFTNIGVPIPVFLIILCISPLFLIKNIKNFIYLYSLLILAALQIFFTLTPFNEYFFRKIIGITLFCYGFYLAKYLFSENYIKYVRYSLVVTFLYALYSAPSYLLGYQNFLIPGTCQDNNISPFGLLRCSTFGEGNYFGTYSALMGILFIGNIRMLSIALICSLISFSPIPIFVNIYLFITKFNCKLKNIIYILLIILSLFFSVLFFIYGLELIPLSIKEAWDSPMSSVSERLEFIRSSFLMFLDHPLFGVGFGQFGNVLTQFTNFEHLEKNTINGFIRYIPNNFYAETMAEQGLCGLLFAFYFFRKLYDSYTGLLGKRELMFLVLLLLITVPTLYQIVLGVILGILSSRKVKMISNSSS